jgi:hypothetical protein
LNKSRERIARGGIPYAFIYIRVMAQGAAHDPLVDDYVDGVLQLSDGQIMERENPPGQR